jgi:hypothetical protein
MRYVITDATGMVISSRTIECDGTSQQEIILPEKPGTYFLHVNLNGNEEHKKLIKF